MATQAADVLARHRVGDDADGPGHAEVLADGRRSGPLRWRDPQRGRPATRTTRNAARLAMRTARPWIGPAATLEGRGRCAVTAVGRGPGWLGRRLGSIEGARGDRRPGAWWTSGARSGSEGAQDATTVGGRRSDGGGVGGRPRDRRGGQPDDPGRGRRSGRACATGAAEQAGGAEQAARAGGDYVVLYDAGADRAAARRRHRGRRRHRAGGERGGRHGHRRRRRCRLRRPRGGGGRPATGAARNRPIGQAHRREARPEDVDAELAAASARRRAVPATGRRIDGPSAPRPEAPRADDDAELDGAAAAPATGATAATDVDVDQNVEPMADRQWDLAIIGATARGSYDVTTGRRSVTVAVIDTGIDATHPDLAGRVDVARSRNFTVDIPSSTASARTSPTGACTDPVDVDENGHGTHVAGTIAAVAQRHRHRRRRCPRRHARQPAGRPGLGLLLPRADASTPSPTPPTSGSTWST